MLVKGHMSWKRTGPWWCTVNMEMETNSIPIGENPLGSDPRSRDK